MAKIAKAQGRDVKEWVGKDANAKVPPHVRLRILRRYNHTCYLSGIKIADGQAFDLEDIEPVEEGGQRRESNLAPALRLPHEVKTAVERKRQAKADRAAKKAHGLHDRKSPPMQSRGFETTGKKPRIERNTLPPRALYEDAQ